MPTIPASTLTAIKRAAPLAAVLTARGVDLTRQGRDLVCCCPLPAHDDRTPSFHVTEGDGESVAHCFGCDWAGNVFQLLQQLDGCSFVEAVRTAAQAVGLPFAEPVAAGGGRQKAAVVEPCPLDPEATGAVLDEQVLAFAQKQLLEPENPGRAYLEKRGVWSADVAARFRLGFLPGGKLGRILREHRLDKQRVAGRRLREALCEAGWWSAKTGHATMDGRVLFPIFDGEGTLAQCYGRTVHNLSHGTPPHRHLARPVAGVWNADGLVDGDGAAVVCEAALDALSFAVAGIGNVTFGLGAGNVDAEHLAALRAAGARSVFLAFDNDRAGNDAAAKLSPEMIAEGLAVYRVQVEPGSDINAVAQEAGGGAATADALRQLLRDAAWIGGGESATTVAVEGILSSPAAGAAEPPAAPAAPADAESAEGRGLAVGLPEGVAVEEDGDDFHVIVDDARRYRLRGLAQNSGDHTLKMTLTVDVNGAVHADQLDLYQGRQRAAFVKTAADLVARSSALLQRDLGMVLQVSEAWQARRAADRARAQLVAQGAGLASAVELSAIDRAEAEDLLADPQLLKRIVDDLSACGLVGETVNKLGCYLAATSRLMQRPLAVLVQSSSAAGKTALMDAVLALMPEEARKRASAISEMALYYEPRGLSHTILAIAEEEGAASASYSLKLLQSDGALTFSRPVKDPDTGELVTKTHTVDGPVQLMLTTTKTLLDDELANRCLVLTVEEDAEQTSAIHARQRLAQSWEGQELRARRRSLARLHQNAQRLLRPLIVVNPYGDQLRFTAARVRARRDHQKYLDLIASVTLLHQFQRKRETRRIDGRDVDAVIVDLADIAVANELAHVLLGQSLDELSAPSRGLLQLIDDWVSVLAAERQVPREDVWFQRRDLIEPSGRSHTSLKRQLAELVDQEWLLVERATTNAPMRYRVHFAPGDPERSRVCLGLTSVRELDETYVYDGCWSTPEGSRSTCGPPVVHPRSTRGPVPKTDETPVNTLAKREKGPNGAKTAHTGEIARASNTQIGR